MFGGVGGLVVCGVLVVMQGMQFFECCFVFVVIYCVLVEIEMVF